MVGSSPIQIGKHRVTQLMTKCRSRYYVSNSNGVLFSAPNGNCAIYALNASLEFSSNQCREEFLVHCLSVSTSAGMSVDQLNAICLSTGVVLLECKPHLPIDSPHSHTVFAYAGHAYVYIPKRHEKKCVGDYAVSAVESI